MYSSDKELSYSKGTQDEDGNFFKDLDLLIPSP